MPDYSDLEALDVPFCELPRKTRKRLVAACYVDKRIVEIYGSGHWQELSNPRFFLNAVYRLAPTPRPELTPDSIDWSHVAQGFDYCARDNNGEAYLSQDLPTIASQLWCAGIYVRADVFASYRPGTVDWRDSLITRPGRK